MAKVIGIDHGYGYMKTANHEFRTGIKEFKNEPPIMQRVVKYNDRYYSVGGTRQNVRLTKWQDENYWIMTLAAIAEELREETRCEVILAVGLPLTRFGAEKQDFQRYLKREGVIDFQYQKTTYSITIKDVMVFPQGYSAIANKIDTLSGMRVICDVGSWTIDVLPLENGIPNMNRITSLDMGVIKAMNNINEELRRELGGEVEETVLQDIMLGKDVKLSFKYMENIKSGLTEYATEVLLKLKELGFNTDTTPFIFTGGGSSLIKRYGSGSYDSDMTSFMEDIHENAKGYEKLAKVKLGGV